MADAGPGSTEKAAIALVTRAVTLDHAKRFTEAFTCYQEGIELLMEAIKGMNDKTRANGFRAKASTYLTRAEQIKAHITSEKDKGKYTEHYAIEHGSSGHSYNSVMGRFLGHDVEWVQIDDPYIRKPYQCQNFLRLCELVVLKCPAIKNIQLTTGGDCEADQMKRLGDICTSLSQRGVVLTITHSNTLHDRHIKLSTGWMIKIGRGLDYFKSTENNMSIGYFDLDLRPCLETSVDIFFVKKL